MVLSEYALAHSGFSFRILATDVSTTVLEKAQLGIYSSEVVRPVPPALKAKYLMRSRDRGVERVRVVPELRRLVEFRRLNFMDPDYGITRKAGAIFCRNVIIYFDRATQQRILSGWWTAWSLGVICLSAMPKRCMTWICRWFPLRPRSTGGSMRTPDPSVQEVYLQPGESCLVTRPAIFRTVLGSCVGVAFLVPRLGVAALCHPMLPHCPANLLGSRSGTRYVDFAIRDLARQLDSLGAARTETQVKLFGGGDVLTVADGHSRPTVGRLNLEMALRTLEEEGYSVAASSLGGKSGVQIQFHTDTGEVILRRLDHVPAKRRPKSQRHLNRSKSADKDERGGDREYQQSPGFDCG